MTLNSIGSLRNAARAIQIDDAYGESFTPDNDWTKHWSYVSSGYSRNVYRLGSVVYKVEQVRGTNGLELDNVERLSNSGLLPKGWAIPLTNLYSIDGIAVIAMRYIPGEAIGYAPHIYDLCDQINARLDMADIYGTNILVYRGINWLVDLGE